MNPSVQRGFSFGLTSGIITTLGLIMGLYAGTHSKTVVLGGILTIAFADAFSDALGMHMSEESAKNKETKSMQGVWRATVSTFVTKFFTALTFMIPVLLLDLPIAVVVSILWGMLLITILSYRIAKKADHDPRGVIAEHLFIATLVVIITLLVGTFVDRYF